MQIRFLIVLTIRVLIFESHIHKKKLWSEDVANTHINIMRSYQYAVTHVRNKNSNIQERSPNVVKGIIHTIRSNIQGRSP